MASDGQYYWSNKKKSEIRYTNGTKFWWGENPITASHVYKHARTHEIKLVGCQAENRNSKRRIRFQHECVYDYFMMIIFWTKIALIFTMFHFHAEQFDAGHFQLALNCCRRCCHRIELKNSMFIFHLGLGTMYTNSHFNYLLFVPIIKCFGHKIILCDFRTICAVIYIFYPCKYADLRCYCFFFSCYFCHNLFSVYSRFKGN